jgi:hypothetical protein
LACEQEGGKQQPAGDCCGLAGGAAGGHAFCVPDPLLLQLLLGLVLRVWVLMFALVLMSI